MSHRGGLPLAAGNWLLVCLRWQARSGFAMGMAFPLGGRNRCHVGLETR